MEPSKCARARRAPCARPAPGHAPPVAAGGGCGFQGGGQGGGVGVWWSGRVGGGVSCAHGAHLDFCVFPAPSLSLRSSHLWRAWRRRRPGGCCREWGEEEGRDTRERASTRGGSNSKNVARRARTFATPARSTASLPPPPTHAPHDQVKRPLLRGPPAAVLAPRRRGRAGGTRRVELGERRGRRRGGGGQRRHCRCEEGSVVCRACVERDTARVRAHHTQVREKCFVFCLTPTQLSLPLSLRRLRSVACAVGTRLCATHTLHPSRAVHTACQGAPSLRPPRLLPSLALFPPCRAATCSKSSSWGTAGACGACVCVCVERGGRGRHACPRHPRAPH